MPRSLVPKSVMPRSVSARDHRRALRWFLAALQGLSSPRLAIFILAGWIVACFVGLILPPSTALGFFSSPFIVALGALLGASLVACFVKRAARRRASAAKPAPGELTAAEQMPAELTAAEQMPAEPTPAGQTPSEPARASRRRPRRCSSPAAA